MASIVPIHLPRKLFGFPSPSSRRKVNRVSNNQSLGSLRVAWLTVRVHADAFRLAPLRYLQGVQWRLRRLRVRSRNRIAALAGRSPHAYALWIARDEARILSLHSTPVPGSRVTICPVIDCRDGSAGLDATFASIERADATVCPVLIGGSALTGTRQIQSPRELAALVTSDELWILAMRPGDRLAAGSLTIYAQATRREPGTLLIYADDDLVSQDGMRRAPHFKPDWNPELFEHHDFLEGSCIVRLDRELAKKLPQHEWIVALIRAALARGTAPLHLKLVLHHRRTRNEPRVPAKPAVLPELRSASVTVVIPTRNMGQLLRNCIDGLRRTDHLEVETIIVDNGTEEPRTLEYLRTLEGEGMTVLRHGGPFNYSALNNAAVEVARGELLCFLNNDVEVIEPDWLTLLVGHAKKGDVGAVGPLLLYPDGTIQHAGVFTGIGGGAGHAHRFQRMDEAGYFKRAHLPQRVSAVTGACMVVQRDKFLAVGGFDEDLFPVAFNDVDLCLKLNARGWQSFYEPRSILIHHESRSRGHDKSKADRKRFGGELASLKQKWHTHTVTDPYHHPQLSPFCEQFLIAV